MELKLKVTKKTFIDDNGNIREYNLLTTEVGGQEIRLSVSADDKKLFNYLLSQIK